VRAGRRKTDVTNLRQLVRGLVQAPGFAMTAVITLAIGIESAAVIASYVPARRASRIAPAEALSE